jgi:hypothetical protein
MCACVPTDWVWHPALEDELFLSLSEAAVAEMISYAEELHGTDLVDEHIKSVSVGVTDLSSVKAVLDHGADFLGSSYPYAGAE